jgi:hypothetical protein
VLALAACAFTFVIGAALGISGDPAHLALGAVIGLVTFAGAVAAPRVALVVATFLLVAYVADAAPGVAGRVAVSGAIGALLAATLLRARLDRTSISIPGDAAWILLYVAAYAIVTVAAEDRSAAIKPFFDLVGYGALAILLVALMDNEQWVRRFAWAVASALGLLAILAVYQQLSRSFDTAFGGIARVEFDGGLTRSGGPISANYFGQVLAAGCVLAAYLALAARSRQERRRAGHCRSQRSCPRLYVRVGDGCAGRGRARRDTPPCAPGADRARGRRHGLRRDVPAATRGLSEGARARPTCGTEREPTRRCVGARARTWPRSRWRLPSDRRRGPCNFELRYLDYSARSASTTGPRPAAHSLYSRHWPRPG